MFPTEYSPARTASVIVALCLVAACSSARPVDLGNLEQAEELWAGRSFSDYTYQARIMCFCPSEIVSRVRVEVRDNTITAVSDVATGQAVDPGMWDAWSTIDELFVRIRQVPVSGTVSRVEAAYDEDLGFPRELSFVPIEGLADADWSQTIFLLTPITAD